MNQEFFMGNKTAISKIKSIGYLLTGFVAIIVWLYFALFHYDPGFWPYISFPLLVLGIQYSVFGVVFVIKPPDIHQAANHQFAAPQAIPQSPQVNSVSPQKSAFKKERRRNPVKNIFFIGLSAYILFATFLIFSGSCTELCPLGLVVYGIYAIVGTSLLSLLIYFISPLIQKKKHIISRMQGDFSSEHTVQVAQEQFLSYRDKVQIFYPIFLAFTIFALVFVLTSLPRSIDSYTRKIEDQKILETQKQGSLQGQERFEQEIKRFPLGGTRELFNGLVSATLGVKESDFVRNVGWKERQEEPFRDFSYALNYLLRFDSYYSKKTAFDNGDFVQVPDATRVWGWIKDAQKSLSRIFAYQALAGCRNGDSDVEIVSVTLELYNSQSDGRVTPAYEWFIFIDEKLAYKDISTVEPIFLPEYIQVAGDKINICGKAYPATELSGLFDIESTPGELKIKNYTYTTDNFKIPRNVQAEATLWRKFVSVCSLDDMKKIASLQPGDYMAMTSICSFK